MSPTTTGFKIIGVMRIALTNFDPFSFWPKKIARETPAITSTIKATPTITAVTTIALQKVLSERISL